MSSAETSSFQSPFRLSAEAWEALRGALKVERGGGKGAREGARKSLQRGPRTRVASGPEVAGPETAWKIALRRVGRLGPELGDGKHALLCPWNDDHTTPPPDDSAENASGSCVLLPPTGDNPYGRPHCSHGHCSKRSLYEWAVEIGVEVYAEATCEAKGWRFAAGYLAHRDGMSTAKKKAVNLPGVPQGGEHRGEGEEADEAPFTWVPDEMLSNFDARITATVYESDGQSAPRVFYELQAEVTRELRRPRVLASEFNGLGWVAQQLGASAVIRAGRDTKDRLREAIQFVSLPIEQRHIYTFTGWHRVADRDVYLHAGGAIGADGAAPGVETRFDDDVLRLFKLPAPPEGETLIEGIRACFSLFSIATPDVAIPLFGAVWRAPLGPTGLTLYLAAPPQTGKTMVAALAQAHFGAAMNERVLPATWKQATAASINRLRSLVGDALFLVDDFLITGTTEDLKLGDKVDQVVRAQFGGSGARRLARDGSAVRVEASPRCLLVSTGEVLPRGHSLRSRMLVLQMSGPVAEDMEPRKKTARAGLYASTMAGYVRWLAPRIGAVRAALADESAKVVGKLSKGHDQRTAAQLAEVAIGVKYFLEFARAHNAITGEEADALREQTWAMLKTMIDTQTTSQRSQDPALRFIELVSDVLAMGRGYLTNFEGLAPPSCHLWGWRAKTSINPTPTKAYGNEAAATEDEPEPSFQPGATHLGYIGGGKVWLNANAVMAAAQRLADDTHDPLPLTRDDLLKRLFEKGLLAATEINNARRTYLVRKRVPGKKDALSGLICMAVDTLRPPPEGDRVGEPVSGVSPEGDPSNTEEPN